MVHHEIFDPASATSIFTMGRKTPDSPILEASKGTNYLFATTHEDHLHPPCTVQWDLTASKNIVLISLLCSLKYLTLWGNQVVIHYISATNDISINDDYNAIPKYYAQFLSSENHKDVSSGSVYDSAKRNVYINKNIILDLLFNKLNIFECQVSLWFFVFNDMNYHHIWLILTNTIIPQITMFIPMIKWEKIMLT